MPIWLIVEDEQELHEIMLGMFEVWGINGLSFTDGGEVINWLNKLDEGLVKGNLPQLALVDTRLPGISGIEIANRIRCSKQLSGIAIALMTAYYLSPEEETEAMQHAQADVLIYKPLPAMKELRQLLNGLLKPTTR
jgi:CheY-like chemotaxis protein